MKKLILALLIIYYLLPIAEAQVSQSWTSYYYMNCTNNLFQKVQDIVTDDSGYVYIAGWTCQGGSNQSDALIIKYKPNGDSSWVRRYNNSSTNGNEYLYSILKDATGNIYVSGSSENFSTRGDLILLKYTSAGQQLWVKRYCNFPQDTGACAYDMKFDKAGNIVLAGRSGPYLYTLKCTTTGDTIWTDRYTAAGAAYGYNIDVDNSNNIYVCGMSWNGMGSNYITVKYNSSGARQWTSYYYGANFTLTDYTNKMRVDGGGNVFVGGTAYTDTGHNGYIVIKYNTNGNQRWLKRYNYYQNQDDILFDIALDSISNVYVTGSSYYNTCATLKYDSSGALKWESRITGSGGRLISFDRYGYVYIAGKGGGLGFLKYAPAGNLIWNSGFVYNSLYFGKKFIIDRNNNFILTGNITGITSNTICTEKYNQTTSVRLISTVIPDKFNLEQNFPNPFNPITKIKFDIHPLNPPLGKGGYGGVSLKVFDITGREIQTLVNEQLNPGTYEVTFDGSNLPCGIYFYQLRAGEYMETKKLVLLK